MPIMVCRDRLEIAHCTYLVFSVNVEQRTISVKDTKRFFLFLRPLGAPKFEHPVHVDLTFLVTGWD